MERIAPRCEMFGTSPQPTDGLPAFDWSEDLRLDFGAQKEPDVWEVAAQQRWLHRVHRWEDTSCTQSGTAACRSRARSEEHTSELQSQSNLVCRLLLEKKKQHQY